MCACAPSVFILYKKDLKEMEKLRLSLNFIQHSGDSGEQKSSSSLRIHSLELQEEPILGPRQGRESCPHLGNWVARVS